MKTHRTNRTRTCFRPSITSLERRSLLSHVGLSPHPEAHATTLARHEVERSPVLDANLKSKKSAVSSAGTDVLTYHNDTSRTGANLNETILTPQNVNASDFGKLFSYDLDGQVYAQPLVVSNLRIDGKVHNVLFVATENDSVYALDADNPTVGPHHNGVLWHTSFINPAKGITPVPEQDVQNSGVGPTYGITATPVIDLATKTIYVVSQEKEQPNNAGGQHYVQEFSALNILTGKARTVTIGNTTLQPDGSFINNTKIAVAGTGSGSDDGVVKFNALRQLPRMGLVLDMKVKGHPAGVVFTGSASDGDIDPYHGWLIGYDAKTLKLVTFFNSTPNGDFGGIWQGGGAPDVLPNGNLLLGTGNGTFDAFTTTTAPGAAAQGEGGFGLGSSGLSQSAAIPFAISIPSSGVSSTGLFFNGDTTTDHPRAPDVYQPLDGTGIDFTAGAENPNGPDTFQATLSYSGTTLSETITDLTTGASFSRDYQNVNLPATVGGSDTAIVGFGGGTDGRTSTIAITSWTYSSGGQTLIDNSAGFASNGDVTATGVTKFNGTAADVTTGDGQQAGNLFANSPVNIANFTTTFDFQIHPPSSSTTPVGDGLSFIIQNDPGHAAGPDYGESYLELKPTPGRLTVVSNFTPFDVKARDIIDADTASTAETLLPTFPGTAVPNEAVAADKSGRIYLLNTDNLGGFNAGGPDQVLQEFTANPNGLIYSSPVYFNGMVYIQGVDDVIKAYALQLDPATNTMLLNETPVSEGTTISGFPGEVSSVSADGTSNGIVWSADVDQNFTNGPAVLQAYAANNLSTPLYTSAQAGPRDTAGGAIKFSVPTIANGHVYLGALNEVDAYGLLPPPGSITSPSLSGNAGVSARIAAATVRERRVLAAATPAGPLATRMARAALPSARRTPARAESAGTNPS